LHEKKGQDEKRHKKSSEQGSGASVSPGRISYHARFPFFLGGIRETTLAVFGLGPRGTICVFCNCGFVWFARLEFSTQFVAQDVFDCHLCCSCFLLLLGVVVVVVAIVVIKVVVIVVVVVFVGRRQVFIFSNCELSNMIGWQTWFRNGFAMSLLATPQSEQVQSEHSRHANWLNM
jgi:hypothetical protein